MSPIATSSFHDPTGRFRWPDGHRAAAAFTFDLDAESPILWDAPEARLRLTVMSHQAYGPRTGLPRILALLERKGVRSTFFVPGYSADRHPDAVRAIRDAGHEIAHHGYLHEQVSALSPEAEEAALLRGLEALDRVAGVRPVGWRAPMWEMSYASPAILARHGFRYDSSLMDADRPYLLGPSPGTDAGGRTLVELPIHWGLDDWEQYVYLPGLSGSGRIATPREVAELWTSELDALAEAGGLFCLVNHPFASGRASRAGALEATIDRARATPGLWIATAGEIAAHVETLGLEPVVHEPPVLPPPLPGAGSGEEARP